MLDDSAWGSQKISFGSFYARIEVTLGSFLRWRILPFDIK